MVIITKTVTIIKMIIMVRTIIIVMTLLMQKVSRYKIVVNIMHSTCKRPSHLKNQYFDLKKKDITSMAVTSKKTIMKYIP